MSGSTPIDSILAPRAMADLYRPVAKKFQYSSQVNKEILERRMSDIAELSNSTVSEVLETALVEQLLVSDEHAAPYVNGVLFGKRFTLEGTCVSYGIRNALSEIFEDVSAGIGWKPRYSNARPFVELAAKLAKEHSPKLVMTNDEEPFSVLRELEYAFDSLCSVFRKAAQNLDVPGLDTELRWACEVAQPAIKNAAIEPSKVIDFVLRNWTALEDSTHTFRTLSKLFSASAEWEDTAYDRVRFQNVCAVVMAEWSHDEQESSERKTATDVRPQLEQHPIANGYVLAPSDWITLNPTVAPYADHAGYIEIKHGERYDAPHFLFFVERLVDEMADAEKESLLQLAGNAWDDMELVKEDSVELAYSADGGVANKAEYSAAPRIGWFSIFERGEHPYGRPRYGAEIVRMDSDSAREEVTE